MDNEEREAIRNYKEYQLKWLPNVKTLDKLYSADFEIEINDRSDSENTSTGEIVDRLKAYLDVLREYSKRIVRAAHLRQRHFELFLVEATEDKDHRNWRLGMNEIALDCQEKLAYWTKFQNQAFDKLILDQNSEESRQRKNRKLPRYLDAQNVDHKRTACNKKGGNGKGKDGNGKDGKDGKSKKVAKICRPPQMSRLQQIRFSERLRLELMEKEEKMIEAALEDNVPFYENVEGLAEHDRNIPKITVEELVEELIEHGYHNPTDEKFDMNEIPSVVTLVEPENGEKIEESKLRERLGEVVRVFLDGFIDLISTACHRYGCFDTHECYLTNPTIKDSDVDCKDLKLKMKFLLGYHHVIGRQNDKYAHYGDEAILSWILLNKQVPLESALILQLLSYLCAGMNDDLFIGLWKEIDGRQKDLSKPAQSKNMASESKKSKEELMKVGLAMARSQSQDINHCKILKYNLCKIYPNAQYTQKIMIMEDGIALGDRSGAQYVYKMGWLNVTEIDRKRIEKEIGVKVFASSNEKERYHSTLAKFLQFIR